MEPPQIDFKYELGSGYDFGIQLAASEIYIGPSRDGFSEAKRYYFQIAFKTPILWGHIVGPNCWRPLQTGYLKKHLQEEFVKIRSYSSKLILTRLLQWSFINTN